MKCPVCDAKVPESATFCQQCGAKLPHFTAETDTATSEPSEAPRAAAAPPDSDASDASTMSSRRRGAIVDTPEETLREGSYSPQAMLGTAVLCAVATIVLLVVALAYTTGVPRAVLLAVILVIWALAAGRLATRRLGISYKLTNHMFYHRHGVLTRVTDRIELIEVHDVTYEQGLFERLVDVGSIKIASSDRTDPIFYLLGVQRVETVAQLIDKARRGEQVRRGRRIDFSHIDGET
jgi:membrane protein YdbS with pleckstrin-like domain